MIQSGSTPRNYSCNGVDIYQPNNLTLIANQPSRTILVTITIIQVNTVITFVNGNQVSIFLINFLARNQIFKYNFQLTHSYDK